jgi:chaperonin GroEL
MTTKVELKNVRKVIHEAVNIVGDAVGATMGPGGQCVLLETQAGMPIITKDGVTVANAIEFENQELNIVGKIIKQAADKTNKEAGDGTTTATVLAKEIYNQGYQLIAAGYNSNVLKKQMDAAKVKILSSLDQLSTKIKEESLEETLTHIARISLNGEEDMAKIVAESVVKTGINGLVKVVDNTIAQDEIVSVKGLQFPAGWASPFFADSRDDQKVTLENCAILITSHKLTTLHQLAAMEQTLTYFMQKNIPVLFIASEVSGPFLTNLVANQKKGSLKNCALRPPYFGMVRKEFFTDLAAATGGTVIEAEEKMDLSAVEVKHFGYAKRVEITNLDTTII